MKAYSSTQTVMTGPERMLSVFAYSAYFSNIAFDPDLNWKEI